MLPERMSRAELRAGASLAGVFGLRMLGLFLILPVFAVHAPQLSGGDNLTLVGIALGAYGLSQAILQIPFGMASDRWGRKPVIYVGLVIFAAGSFVAAGAHDIWTTIAGRTLQGAGAISSVVVALAADLTREQHRTKVMAMIGAMIGLAFAVSLVAAPILYQWIGMGGLFTLTGVLCIGAIGVDNTTQTLGLFFGGLTGGWLAKHYGAAAVYAVCALLSVLWLAAALRMRPLAAVGDTAVNEVSSLTFTIASGVNLEGLSEALAAVRGVREAEVLARERIARLKVVPEQWDEGSVRKLLTGEG